MRGRTLRAWIGLGASLFVCIAAGAGALLLANYSWNSVVDYRSPYVGLNVPSSSSGSPVATTTVVVIVDGLSDAASRQLDGFQRLRQYGTDLTLTAPQPSLSFPNWTTLLSGGPPYVSGVTTNWFEGKVKTETLIDTAVRAGLKTVVVGPEEMRELYDTDRVTGSFLKSYPTTTYGSTELVNEAITLIKQVQPRLAIIHLPDVDNAGHRSGADSSDYRDTAKKVDIDIGRLVQGVQGDGTTFVLTSDHGHTASGGHGGWEDTVVRVPGLFFGTGVQLAQGNANQEDVAPTVGVLAGIPVPRFSKGDVLDIVVGDAATQRLAPAWSQRLRFAGEYVRYVSTPTGVVPNTEWADYAHGSVITRAMDQADASRLEFDRSQRLWIMLVGIVLSIAALVVVGIASWRALLGALVGALAYYLVYDGLYFLVHRLTWSLSAFNEETLVQSFFAVRVAEALLAGLIAAAVAALLYPLFRKVTQKPAGEYLPRWLSLGPVSIVVILATLSVQVVWFAWAWGVTPTWRLPDLKWGMKYDLDLAQAFALGLAALLAPLVTYLVGRYHPKTRRPSQPTAPHDPIPMDDAVLPIAEE